MTLQNQVTLVANANTSPASNNALVPKPGAEIVERDGKTVRRDWWRYLNAITAAPAPEQGMKLPASPANWKAPSNGTILISGGTVTGLSLASRSPSVNTSYALPTSTALVPMSTGDQLTIAYTVLPTCTWFPR